MRTKKVRKSRQNFRSVGTSVENSVSNGADGHVSDMRDPSVMPSVCDVRNFVGNGADGHVSDMRDPSVSTSVIDVGNTVSIHADGHVSDMHATIRR
jgi:hypothetical protein